MRIVVVGLGSIGRRHARLLALRPELQVEWCEASSEALTVARKELGEPARVHGSFESMLATKPTLLVIATPHAAHASQAIAALEAGLHVLCEKPLSDSLADAEAIAQAAGRARGVFTVGFQLHFHPALQRAKALIASGELGSIHHLHALVGTYITLVNSKSRYQATLPGALFMDYAHQPDVFHYLTSQTPAGVYTCAGQGGKLPLQSNPNFAVVVCDYTGPLLTTINLNYLQSPDRHEYEIIGDQGWVAIDMFRGELRVGRHGETSAHTESFSTERDPLYVAEHQAFIDAAAGRRPVESSATAALVSMRVVDATIQSWRSHARIALPVS